MTIKTVKDLVAVANGEVETMSAKEALKNLGRVDITFVDVREGEEVAKTGRIAGAVHVPRQQPKLRQQLGH